MSRTVGVLMPAPPQDLQPFCHCGTPLVIHVAACDACLADAHAYAASFADWGTLEWSRRYEEARIRQRVMGGAR